MKVYATKYGDVPGNRLSISQRRAMDHVEAHAPDLRKKDNQHWAEAVRSVEAVAKRINPQPAKAEPKGAT